MNIKAIITNLLFGTDPVSLITQRQAEIVAIQAKAQDKVLFATLDIEDAVDVELENIRQTVAAAVTRMRAIVATNAVHADAAKVLNEAQVEIGSILDRVDAAI